MRQRQGLEALVPAENRNRRTGRADLAPRAARDRTSRHRPRARSGAPLRRRGLDEAWDEFNLFEGEQPFDEDSPFGTLFFYWFLHDWLPDPHDSDVSLGAHGVTAAQVYLNRAGSRLDPIARRHVETCCATPCSFHEVIHCRAGHGMRLREVLLDPKLPELRNTHGDPLETHALVFDLDAREAAVERLAAWRPVSPNRTSSAIPRAGSCAPESRGPSVATACERTRTTPRSAISVSKAGD